MATDIIFPYKAFLTVVYKSTTFHQRFQQSIRRKQFQEHNNITKLREFFLLCCTVFMQTLATKCLLKMWSILDYFAYYSSPCPLKTSKNQHPKGKPGGSIGASYVPVLQITTDWKSTPAGVQHPDYTNTVSCPAQSFTHCEGFYQAEPGSGRPAVLSKLHQTQG